MKVNELFEKSEKLFDYILEECSDEQGQVDKDVLDCLIDRIKSIKDKMLTIEESQSLTIDEIKKQLEKFKKNNTLDVPNTDYID